MLGVFDRTITKIKPTSAEVTNKFKHFNLNILVNLQTIMTYKVLFIGTFFKMSLWDSWQRLFLCIRSISEAVTAMIIQHAAAAA